MTNLSGIEQDPTADHSAAPTDGRRIEIHRQHLRLTQVELQDRTDGHNELVHEREWLLHRSEVDVALRGNLFVLEDLQSGEGRAWIKRAPLPHIRTPACPVDLQVEALWPRGFAFTLHADPGGDLDAWTELTWTGGELARTRTLQAWQRAQRPDTPNHRIPKFLSNTWGDRNRDSRIQHDFILAEIAAAAKLGVDVMQIDDGWQRGTTSNSVNRDSQGGVWEGFWASDAEFWTPHPERLPHGLEPLVAAARDAGMELGLWFAPDSYDDFANWRRDVDCLLDYYRRLGIAFFKVDGIKARSAAGHRNLQRFFDAIRAESDGHIVLDLDITAEERPGYFGTPGVGTLFVENRYTDWHNYWPHQTLRNLWSLSRWLDPATLRMEFLNVARNTQKYADDPLAPALYPPDTLYATVMMSNPLGWFEVSNLPPAYAATVGPLARLWREHREAVFAGTILPVGARPDGWQWTGFLAVADDDASAYLLVFRQAHADADWSLQLPPALANLTATPLAGGTCELRHGHAHCHIPAPFGYLLAKLS